MKQHDVVRSQFLNSWLRHIIHVCKYFGISTNSFDVIKFIYLVSH